MRFTSVLVLALTGLLLPPAVAQRLPREDVVDVPARAEGLCVSNLFQSHMVLQRQRPIALWGWATPGEQVQVQLGEDIASARADAEGAWRVELPAREAVATPQVVTIRGDRAELLLEDVLVGDVWILGGQSNMEFELAKVENGELEIATANYDQLRILTVPYGEGPELRRGFARLHEWSGWFGRHFRKGDWDVCRPEVARELSAIGYVFARRLHMASGVPIGVIDASRGGTTVETWTRGRSWRGSRPRSCARSCRTGTSGSRPGTRRPTSHGVSSRPSSGARGSRRRASPCPRTSRRTRRT